MNVISYAAPEGGGRPENLSELEQRLFYTRVLCSNFSYLYQHLNTPAILATLKEKELIQPDDFSNIKQYSETHAQNALAIHNMQPIKAPPNCMDKLCDTLQTKEQSHVADRLLTGKTGTSDVLSQRITVCAYSSLQDIRSWQNMATLSDNALHFLHLWYVQSLLICLVHSSNY